MLYEKIKLYYEKGYYKEKHLKAFLNKDVITKEEYNSILFNGMENEYE